MSSTWSGSGQWTQSPRAVVRKTRVAYMHAKDRIRAVPSKDVLSAKRVSSTPDHLEFCSSRIRSVSRENKNSRDGHELSPGRELLYAEEVEPEGSGVPEASRIGIRPIAIDLFSGAGGATLGLRMAGFDVPVAVELDEEKALTLRKNHPSTRVLGIDGGGDVRTLS